MIIQLASWQLSIFKTAVIYLTLKKSSMSTRFSKEDHANLEKEFSHLGFDYQEIRNNDIIEKDDNHSKMFGLLYPDHLPTPADGITVSFIIKHLENGNPPHIESIIAILFSGMNSGKFHEIVKKGYLVINEILPTKQQIYTELIQMAKTISELHKNLNDEFTRHGFDLIELAPTLQHDGKVGIHMTKLITDDARLNPGHKLFFLFTIINAPADNQCYIQHLSAYLARKDADSNKSEILAQKHYECYESPLPTKDQVFVQLNELLKIQEIKEKFSMNPSPGQQELIHNKASIKKGL
jgi:hypothetical protein